MKKSKKLSERQQGEPRDFCRVFGKDRAKTKKSFTYLKDDFNPDRFFGKYFHDAKEKHYSQFSKDFKTVENYESAIEKISPMVFSYNRTVREYNKRFRYNDLNFCFSQSLPPENYVQYLTDLIPF
jgi:hypothetical protein